MWLERGGRIRCFGFVILIAGFILQHITRVLGYGVNEQLYFEVLHPSDVAYTYKIRAARDFGDVVTRPLRNIQLVPTEPKEACGQLISNGEVLLNQVALIERGGCSFVTKALNAELNGAKAVIVSDNNYDEITQWIDMVGDGTERTVGIPAYFMLGKDGQMIRQSIQSHNLFSATINVPVNYTYRPTPQQPPWDLW